MSAHDLIFHEELFAQTAGWTPVYSDSRLTQRCRMEPRGAMYTETRLPIRAPVDAVVARLWGEWTWWRKGRYCNRVEHPDGTVQYDHYPFGINVHVNSIMYPPLKLESGGWRIRVEISDYMTGTMYFDVIPRADGSSELVSRFSRCWVSGPYRFLPYPGHIAARIHLAAERGRFVWPRGTGFVGLLEELENPGCRPL
jgi:hypothetical protein